MEMIENAVYSSTQISTAPQTQRDCKPRENDSLRCPVSCFVVIPLGFLAAVLLSLLIYNWSLYNDSSCPSCPSCPDFWMRHQSNCYYFSTERKIWDLGLEFCKASKSTLIMLTDSKEMELLKDFCSRDYYWIGLKNDSGWRWLDGSVLNSSSIHVNSLVQKCGVISQHGISASSCEVPLQWICKKPRL